MTTFAGNMVLNLSGTYSKTPGLGSLSYQPSINTTFKPTNGTANGQADLLYDKEHTIAAGADLDLDLAGALVDAFGDTLAMVEACMVALVADVANDADLVVGGHPTAEAQLWFSGAGDKSKLAAGAVELHTHPGAGWPVTAGTADMLRINNPGAVANKVKVMIWGRSA